MIKEIAKLHVRALPHTLSSRMGVKFVRALYYLVSRVGYVKVATRSGKMVGAVSGIGPLILTLVVDPDMQRRGVGRELIGELVGKRCVYTEQCTSGFYEKLGFKPMCKMGQIIFLCRK